MGNPPRWPHDTPLSAKVDTKIRQQVAVAQSVQFACGLKAAEFVFDHMRVISTIHQFSARWIINNKYFILISRKIVLNGDGPK
jgi:hypothetical protein